MIQQKRIDLDKLEQRWSKTQKRQLEEGLQAANGGTVQGRSEKRCRGIDRHGGREARLARGGIREHDAFLGHEMRGPAGTERGGVSMAGGGKAKAQGRGMG